MVPAIYIQVAGGLNLAATKKPKVAGSVNLPTMCGMKNSAQIRRRSTIGLSRLNLSAHDMRSPVARQFGSFQWIARGGARPFKHPRYRVRQGRAVPAIHAFLLYQEDVDARHKARHDVEPWINLHHPIFLMLAPLSQFAPNA